ncbi:MAG: hypothetical protein ACRDZN_12305, partial [Acidimicrobiales bacterium]
RTVVTARAAVGAAPGAVPADAIRRDVVRGPAATVVDGSDADEANFGPLAGGVVRFTLPNGADPATPLEVEGPASIRQAEVWVGDRWVPVALASDRGGGGAGDRGVAAGGGVVTKVPSVAPAVPAPGGPLGHPGPTVVADPAPPPVVADPGDPAMRVVGQLPAGAVHDGVVYLRVGAIMDGTGWSDVSLRGAA